MSGFRHEALLYAGESEFVESTSGFVRDGIEAEEPVLVVVSARKIELLREALADAAPEVHFADMAEVGSNPARIIPAWREFVNGRVSGARRARGVGEPIWAGRSTHELVECQRHESLLNLAFAGDPAWWLLCPYDTAALDPPVIEEAYRSHPFVLDGSHEESAIYRGLDEIAAPFALPLPEPAGEFDELVLEGGLESLRDFVSGQALAAGLPAGRTSDLVAAVYEAASNSLRHGGGRGILRVWTEDGAVVCEVRDGGRIDQPLVGRIRPAVDGEGGRGLWLVNHLCDLAQIRSCEDGTVVRLHMRLPA